MLFLALLKKQSRAFGYIDIFFTSCWDTIKHNLIRAIHQFYLLNQHGLLFLNQAFVVIISKEENPQGITDYRSISLTHSFAKLITKILANRLGPELDNLFSINWATFIRKKCIHDNFMFVTQVIKELHRKKSSYPFYKA
jgi:hypothetical protein